MNTAVWSLEWRIARRRRRVFVLNLAIPLLLVSPVALSDSPAHHAAAVYAVLFVLFGTFGAAIPLVRDADRGLLARVILTGFPARRLVLQRVLAHGAIDTLQLLPALAVIVAAGDVPPGAGPAPLAFLLATTLLAANALGVWIAAVARSIAEAALFAAVVGLFALHGAGVFRTPAPGSAGEAIERLLPFRYLHEALLPAAPGAPGDAGALLAAAGGAVVLAGATVLAAPVLIGRLSRASS